MQEYYGFQGATTTVETSTLRWKQGQPYPIFEEMVNKLAPEGFMVDMEAINDYKVKHPDELTHSTEGIKTQIDKVPNAPSVLVYFVTAYRRKELNKNFISQ